MENNNKFILATPFLLLISIFLLSIGFASINSITGEIKGTLLAIVQNGVFITDVSYVSSVDTNQYESKINGYHKSTLNSSIFLSPTSKDSSITYKVTLYNNTNENYYFNGVLYAEEFYDNENIIFNLTGIEQGDVIKEKSYITFNITFSYLNNEVSDNNILNSYLNFEFLKSDEISGNDNLKVVYTITEEWSNDGIYYYRCDFTVTNIGRKTINKWSIDIPLSTEYIYNTSWEDTGSVIFNFDDPYNINFTSGSILGGGSSINFSIQIGVKDDNFDFDEIKKDSKINITPPNDKYFTTAGIDVKLTEFNNWSTDTNKYFYQYLLEINNNTDEIIKDWQIVISVPNGSDIYQFWNLECEIVDNVIIITLPSKELLPNSSYTDGGIIIMTPDSYYEPVIERKS